MIDLMDVVSRKLTMNKVGLSISKNVENVAREALKANMVCLCPMVLPLTGQIRYGLPLVIQKMKILAEKNIYIPDFRKGFEHFHIHTGGRTVIIVIARVGQIFQTELTEPNPNRTQRFFSS